MDSPPLPGPAPDGGWPVPAAGWRLDDHGILTARGRRIPWAEIDRFAQVEDEDDVSRVRAVLRDGAVVTIPGLATARAGQARVRAGQVEALNAIAEARRTPSVLVFPVVLRASRARRLGSTLAALPLSGLAVALIVTLSSPGVREAPGVVLAMLALVALLVATVVHLVHRAWARAIITATDVVVRSPFVRRRVPLAQVFAFQHHVNVAGRSCTALHWRGEPGRHWASLDLPGRDPEYRLPALDAYVQARRR